MMMMVVMIRIKEKENRLSLLGAILRLGLLLHVAPLDSARREEGSGGQEGSDEESPGEGVVVYLLEDACQVVGESLHDGERTNGNHGIRVEGRDAPLDTLAEKVVDDGVTNGKGDGTAETLQEDDDGSTGRHVGDGKHSLHGQHGLLKTGTDTSTGNHGEKHPHGSGRVDLEGGHETVTDGHEHTSGHHDRLDVAEVRDGDTRGDGDQDIGSQHGHDAETGLDGVLATDTLVPGGVVEYDQEESGTHEEGEERRGPDGLLLHDARGDRGVFTAPLLEGDEDGDEDEASGQETDDLRRAPGETDTTPLEGEQEADHGAHEDEGAGRVEREDTLLDGDHLDVALRVGEEEEHNQDDDTTLEIDGLAEDLAMSFEVERRQRGELTMGRFIQKHHRQPTV